MHRSTDDAAGPVCGPYDRLIEPLGILRGAAARDAHAAGLALPIGGGEAMFTAARLIRPGGAQLVQAVAIPAGWAPELARLTAAIPLAGLPPGPVVMGILNTTPDSFSDGGRHLDPDRAVAAGLAMARAGAELIDVGGESTRPGAEPVTPEQELARVLPVVAALCAAGVRVSIDTRNAATMRAALRAGALLVNDVSGLAHDPAARGVVAGHGCPAVLMHMRGTPRDMASLADYDDVAATVVRELAASVAEAMRAGIPRQRLLVDPGIGFAKTTAHNLALLARLPLLANLGCRVVLGASRKRFIAETAGGGSGLPPARRDPGSIAAALAGLVLPDIVLRVHDVPGTVQAVRLWRAMRG